MARNPRLVAASNYAKARDRLDELRAQLARTEDRRTGLLGDIAAQEAAVKDAEVVLKDLDAPAAAPT